MSETLRDLVVSLSLNSDNFTRNIKSINKQIQEAESAFRLASAGVENFETTTAGLSSKLSTLQRTFQLQQDAVGQYERALQQASDKLQECYTRQNDYAQRLTDAKDKQQQLKTEVASAAQAYKHYKNTLGETDSATIAAKANLDAYTVSWEKKQRWCGRRSRCTSTDIRTSKSPMRSTKRATSRPRGCAGRRQRFTGCSTTRST